MFKFVLLCALVAAASAVHHQGHHAAAATSDDVHAEVRHYSADVHDKGFKYAYETTNGISAAASGDENGNANGDFSWISPEGEHVAVQYVADENGYQPQSSALPVPPPIPAAILRSLEYIRTHPPKELVKGRRF